APHPGQVSTSRRSLRRYRDSRHHRQPCETFLDRRLCYSPCVAPAADVTCFGGVGLIRSRAFGRARLLAVIVATLVATPLALAQATTASASSPRLRVDSSNATPHLIFDSGETSSERATSLTVT